MLTIPAPSSELYCFAEIHWFDTGLMQPSRQPHQSPWAVLLSRGADCKQVKAYRGSTSIIRPSDLVSPSPSGNLPPAPTQLALPGAGSTQEFDTPISELHPSTAPLSASTSHAPGLGSTVSPYHHHQTSHCSTRDLPLQCGVFPRKFRRRVSKVHCVSQGLSIFKMKNVALLQFSISKYFKLH